MRALRLGRSAATGLAGDARGVSAIEFALVLPLMLALLFGGIEFGRAWDHKRKAALLARTVADLAAQGDVQNPMSAAAANDIMRSAKLILAPYDAGSAQIVVSALGASLSLGITQAAGLSVTIGSNRPRVCSSYATENATKRPTGVAGDLTVPEGFQLAGSRYILVEASVPYRPMFGGSLMRAFVGGANNQFTFTPKVSWPVRGGQSYYGNANNEIVLPGGSPCPLLAW